METKTILIPNISCKHCIMAIKSELNDLNGVKQVEGDPDTRTITVKWDPPATIESIKNKLKEINYPPAE